MIDRMVEEIPAHYREGIATVDVSPRTVSHPERAGIYTMGECISLEVNAADDQPSSRVVLYHGSFAALAGERDDFDWQTEAWETLTHELRHHLESRARERGLERLVVRTQERAFFLKTETIDWIEAAGKYVHLHVGKTTHPIRGSMASLEQELDPARFVRISRSAIVNIDRIQEIQPWFQGDHVVILQDRTRLTSTRGYRENLQRLLGK